MVCPKLSGLKGIIPKAFFIKKRAIKVMNFLNKEIGRKEYKIVKIKAINKLFPKGKQMRIAYKIVKVKRRK